MTEEAPEIKTYSVGEGTPDMFVEMAEYIEELKEHITILGGDKAPKDEDTTRDFERMLLCASLERNGIKLRKHIENAVKITKLGREKLENAVLYKGSGGKYQIYSCDNKYYRMLKTNRKNSKMVEVKKHYKIEKGTKMPYKLLKEIVGKWYIRRMLLLAMTDLPLTEINDLIDEAQLLGADSPFDPEKRPYGKIDEMIGLTYKMRDFVSDEVPSQIIGGWMPDDIVLPFSIQFWKSDSYNMGATDGTWGFHYNEGDTWKISNSLLEEVVAVEYNGSMLRKKGEYMVCATRGATSGYICITNMANIMTHYPQMPNDTDHYYTICD